MRKYKRKDFETPVIYNFFLRKDLINKVFKQIAKIKPKILILASDGPRSDFEINLVEAARLTVEALIDWDCEIFRLYSEVNLGYDRIMDLAFSTCFQLYDRAIVLEEDIYPSLSFFEFCDELLDKYINDDGIFMISGMNYLSEYPINDDPSYIYVNSSSSSGIAIWKRTFEMFEKNLSKLLHPYYLDAIKSLMKNRNKFHHYQHLRFVIDNPDFSITHGEFWLMGLNQNILFNSLCIIPCKNLVKDIGATDDSENSDSLKSLTSRMRKFYNLQVFEMQFPLIHPIYRIVDYNYSKLVKKEFGNRGFFFGSLDKIERIVRVLVFGGPKKFILKVKKRLFILLNYELKKRRFK